MSTDTLEVIPHPARQIVRITVDQYHRMIEDRIIREGAPSGLRKGLLVYKDRSTHGEDPMSVGDPHRTAIGLLERLNPSLKGLGCYMQTQNPIVVFPDHEPEPDGAIVRGDLLEYSSKTPTPDDVTCVIEVADSSLSDDLGHKLAEYAEHKTA